MANRTLSLCMIVKNEETTIGKCLSSVVNMVDEIIIVDTGSVDKTKEIAEKFGAKIYDFEWSGDFSEARNYANSHATKDWIISLDADEFLTSDDPEYLKKEIQQAKTDILVIHINNLTDEEKIGKVHLNARVYKNSPNIVYENKIHEQVVDINKPGNVSLSGIHILHSGYTNEFMDKRNKHERNIAMITEVLNSEPDNGLMHFYLGNEYLVMKLFDKAIECYRNAQKNNKYKTIEHNILIHLVSAFIQSERFDEVLYNIHKGKQQYPDYTDLYYFEAETFLHAGRVEDAKLSYLKCLELGNPTKYTTLNGVGDSLPLERLIKIYLAERDFDNFINHCLLLLRHDKYNSNSINMFFHALSLMHSEEDVLTLMNEMYLNSNEADIITKLKICQYLRYSKPYIELCDEYGADLEKDFNSYFFYLMFKNLVDDSFNVLIENKERDEQWNLFCVMHFMKFKDKRILELPLSVDAKNIILILSKQILPSELHDIKDKDFFKMCLHESLRSKDNETFELLSLVGCDFVKDIPQILHHHFQDDEAAQFVSNHMSKDDGDFDNYCMASMVYLRNGEYGKSLELAKKAMETNPSSFKPKELQIESLIGMGDFNEALRMCKKYEKKQRDSLYLINKNKELSALVKRNTPL